MKEIIRFIDLFAKSAREESQISGGDARASYRLARATLIQAIERKLEPKWLPIESAPKDGTIMATDGKCVHECHYWPVRDDWFFFCDLGSVHYIEATHWHHVPEPPKLKGE